jgi:hypothetical protein
MHFLDSRGVGSLVDNDKRKQHDLRHSLAANENFLAVSRWYGHVGGLLGNTLDEIIGDLTLHRFDLKVIARCSSDLAFFSPS